MKSLKGVLPALLLLAAWMAGVGTAAAQPANSIEGFDVTQQSGTIVVRVTTREPLQGVPPNFTVANPSRIAQSNVDDGSASGNARALDQAKRQVSVRLVPAYGFGRSRGIDVFPMIFRLHGAPN